MTPANKKKSATPEGSLHTGMRIEAGKLGKLRHIATTDKRTFTAVLDFAIEDYIAKWEKANGTISADQINEALKK